MGKLLRFLVLACVVQAVAAQGLFKGFVPDENGISLDAKASQRVSPGAIFKDCVECPVMVEITGDVFVMGSVDVGGQPLPYSRPVWVDTTVQFPENEKPPHQVNLRSFLIGKTEVTQGQWKFIMGKNPSKFVGWSDELPVENVSWNEVQEFIKKLNQKTSKKYRLPSEAEWEFAARAGASTKWSFGDNPQNLKHVAWYAANSDERTHPVAQKLPNALGLYDMYGNVWEWVEDCWHENYLQGPSDGSAWTEGCSGNSRALRGGSWGITPEGMRSTSRGRLGADERSSHYGFRLARDL